MALAPSLAWLFAGRLISAVAAASFTTANAYIADVSAPEQRARSFGMIGAAFGLGFIIGPLLGGMLGDIQHRLPFWCAAGLSLLNFCYGLFVLPESLPKEKRSARFDWQHAKPMGGVKLLRDYPQIWGLVGVAFLANFAHYVYPSTFVLFADAAFGWKVKQAGYVLAGVGALSVIVNVGLIGWLVKQLGERRALLLGLCCGVTGFLIYGLAPAGWVFLLGMPISALWALAGPSTQALITRQVPADMQGRVQGAMTGLVALAGIVAPLLFATSFGYFIGPTPPLHLPGIAFLLASALLALAAWVGWRYTDAAHFQAMAPAAQPAQDTEVERLG